MERAGAIQFERGNEGKLAIVLLVEGQAVARSQHPVNIAFEVAVRDLKSLSFDQSLRVPIPCDRSTLQLLQRAAASTPEFSTVFHLVSECAW